MWKHSWAQTRQSRTCTTLVGWKRIRSCRLCWILNFISMCSTVNVHQHDGMVRGEARVMEQLQKFKNAMATLPIPLGICPGSPITLPDRATLPLAMLATYQYLHHWQRSTNNLQSLLGRERWGANFYNNINEDEYSHWTGVMGVFALLSRKAHIIGVKVLRKNNKYRLVGWYHYKAIMGPQPCFSVSCEVQH